MKKRILALFLLTVMLLGLFCGCGEEEKDSGKKNETVWLPLGLKFGQSYDSFCKVLGDKGYAVPELNDATANNGYLTENISEGDTNFDWSFLGSATLTKLSTSEEVDDKINYSYFFPSWSFSFNQNKELYEMYIMINFASNEDGTVDHGIISEIIESFDKKFGTKGADKAEGEVLASYENDKMGSSLLFESEYIPYRDRLIIVLHNKEHATVTKE